MNAESSLRWSRLPSRVYLCVSVLISALSPQEKTGNFPACSNLTFENPAIMEGRMKAVVYNGPRDIAVASIPDPRIEQPTDVLVRIIATNICGSDLHMYEGRTDVEPGKVLG